MADDDLRDDDFEEPEERPRRARRRRMDGDERPAKAGVSPLVIVLLVFGVLGVVGVVCGGIGLALMLPAVQKVREAAARQSSQNNMKVVMLGAFNYETAVGRLPGTVPQPDARGLSFRVDLLPYIEHESLYKSIDLQQPWNSPKNLPATEQPVKFYLDVANPASVGNMTPYRVFVGPKTIFGGEIRTFIQMKDGTSNTIFFVAATQTVPWAKPDELPYGPGVPLPPLGSSPAAGGFNAAFADGSVRFIRSTIPEADLRSLIEPADGRGRGLGE